MPPVGPHSNVGTGAPSDTEGSLIKSNGTLVTGSTVGRRAAPGYDLDTESSIAGSTTAASRYRAAGLPTLARLSLPTPPTSIYHIMSKGDVSISDDLPAPFRSASLLISRPDSPTGSVNSESTVDAHSSISHIQPQWPPLPPPLSIPVPMSLAATEIGDRNATSTAQSSLHYIPRAIRTALDQKRANGTSNAAIAAILGSNNSTASHFGHAERLLANGLLSEAGYLKLKEMELEGQKEKRRVQQEMSAIVPGASSARAAASTSRGAVVADFGRTAIVTPHSVNSVESSTVVNPVASNPPPGGNVC